MEDNVATGAGSPMLAPTAWVRVGGTRPHAVARDRTAGVRPEVLAAGPLRVRASGRDDL